MSEITKEKLLIWNTIDLFRLGVISNTVFPKDLVELILLLYPREELDIKWQVLPSDMWFYRPDFGWFSCLLIAQPRGKPTLRVV